MAERAVILGTDWWSDCDDAVALRLLARAHKAKQIKLLGVVINACMDCSVPSLDGFLQLENVSGIPIGIDLEATDFYGVSSYQWRLAPFARDYPDNAAAEDGVRLYRRLLAEAQTPVELMEIGFLQVLAGLLRSQGDDISPKTGMELVKEKVKKIWIMAGKWDEPKGAEHNFNNNLRSRAAGDYVCRCCPVPITFLGFEVGVDVITGGNLDKEDFLHQVLCDHGTPKGRCSWDPMLVLLALTGDEETAGYRTVRGTAAVDPLTGENTFTVADTGLHRYVVKIWPNEKYQGLINGIIA